LLVPILFSFQGEPTDRHLAHLDRRWVDRSTERLVHIVQYQRPMVYAVTAVVVVIVIALLLVAALGAGLLAGMVAGFLAASGL
jgi:hypothetical protein